jgi:hypothetical protein
MKVLRPVGSVFLVLRREMPEVVLSDLCKINLKLAFSPC